MLIAHLPATACERSQTVEIHFGVDYRGLGVVVTQQVAYSPQGSAPMQHVGRYSMSKLTCSARRSVDAGSLKAVPNNRFNTTGPLKTANRRFDTADG